MHIPRAEGAPRSGASRRVHLATSHCHLASFYCKYCGHKTTSVNSLTASRCPQHPNGPGKGRYALYEGGEKESCVCKYCGLKSTSIESLTSSKCQRHPDGPAKGRHEPAL